MDTLSQVLVAVVALGRDRDPARDLVGAERSVRAGARPVLDAMQTMPAFVYLVPVIALFSVGRVPGVIAVARSTRCRRRSG